MDAASSSGVVRSAIGDAFAFNWAAAQPVAALYCLPGILLPLIAGRLLGSEVAGLIAASGALVVGFGAFQRLPHFRTGPMLLAGVGAAFSAFVGTLVSGVVALEALAGGAWALGLGVFTALGTASWWVLLQCAIAEVIAATFPAHLHFALERAALVGGGGAVQAVVILILRALLPRPFQDVRPPGEEPAPGSLRELRAALRPAGKLTPARLRYCAALALSTAAGVLLFRGIGYPNGYWIPMTVLLVLRWGGLRTTLGRAIARCAGTLLGSGLLTLAAAVLRPSPAALVAAGLAAAWVCFTMQWVNYAALSVGVTSFVVVGFALAGLPEPVVALHRSVATLLGGAVALSGQLALRSFGPDTG